MCSVANEGGALREALLQMPTGLAVGRRLEELPPRARMGFMSCTVLAPDGWFPR